MPCFLAQRPVPLLWPPLFDCRPAQLSCPAVAVRLEAPQPRPVPRRINHVNRVWTQQNSPRGPAGRRVLCEYCTAKCCRYFALPIETPETFEEFEFIRWFLLHDRASVFQEDDDWYLLVHTDLQAPAGRQPLRHLRNPPANLPRLHTDNCEYDDDWTYDFYLETAEQVWEYTEAVLPKKGKSIRSRKPALAADHLGFTTEDTEGHRRRIKLQ